VLCPSPAPLSPCSPHLPGELSLWPSRVLRRLHRDRHNLFFRDLSSWRWSEFSAHPRVLTFADRTGLKGPLGWGGSRCLLLTFLVGAEAGCQRGERLLLSKYLGHSEPFHHLVATQFSVFVLDERFPLVPVLSWEHMMQRPPIYAHLVPARPPQTSHKVLLGAHHSQEMLLLQYSGGHGKGPCTRHPHLALRGRQPPGGAAWLPVLTAGFPPPAQGHAGRAPLLGGGEWGPRAPCPPGPPGGAWPTTGGFLGG
uniref:TATA-box binding protein associated factor, RNA polymerase I subunit C n=1 Tax=Pseudonaja textilis TaxID=8673 RepID=A0A670Z6J1_PSETE